MKKLCVGVTALILFLGCTTGCTETKKDATGKETKKEYAQNEVATYEEVDYSIINVEKSVGDEWNKPTEGKEFIIVTIKIENKSDKKVAYNEFDWKMQNSAGQEDGTTFNILDNDTALNSGDLVAGGSKEGTIVFEQPTGDTELKLNYYGNVFDDSYIFQFKLD